MNKENLVKNIGKIFLIFLLFNYSWMFQLIPVMLFNLNVEKLSDSTQVLLSGFSSLVLAIVLFFIFRKDIISEFKKFKNKFWDNFDIGVKHYFIGLVLMIGSNILINNLFGGDGANNEDAVQSMITTLPWMMLITAGFLAPWSEELIFRKNIRNIFKNKWFYATISGLLFGFAHVVGQTNNFVDWLFIIPYGSLGFFFATSYYDTDTIFTPIMFHMLHNVVLILTSIF